MTTTFIPLSWGIIASIATLLIGAVGGAIMVGMLIGARKADETLTRGAEAQETGDDEPMHHDEYVCGVPVLKRCSRHLMPWDDKKEESLPAVRCLLHEGHSGPCDWPLSTRQREE